MAARLLATPPGQVALPSVVVYEIEVGLLRSGDPAKRRREFGQLLAAVRVLEFGRQEAEAAARLRVELEARGTPIGPLDVLIAGTALAHSRITVRRL